MIMIMTAACTQPLYRAWYKTVRPPRSWQKIITINHYYVDVFLTSFLAGSTTSWCDSVAGLVGVGTQGRIQPFQSSSAINCWTEEAHIPRSNNKVPPAVIATKKQNFEYYFRLWQWNSIIYVWRRLEKRSVTIRRQYWHPRHQQKRIKYCSYETWMRFMRGN